MATMSSSDDIGLITRQAVPATLFEKEGFRFAKGDMMDYLITPMTNTHIEPLAALEKQCFSSPWSLESIEEELHNPLAHYLVAVAGSAVVGYIGTQEIAGECYITNIAVPPEHRRSGIAQALLTAAQEGAVERACAFITLEVRVSNMPAIALYSKNGFAVAGERRDFYTKPDENAYIMTKYFDKGASS